MQVHVKSTGLSSFAMHESGALCAAGSADGDATILELSSNFVAASSTEKQVGVHRTSLFVHERFFRVGIGGAV